MTGIQARAAHARAHATAGRPLLSVVAPGVLASAVLLGSCGDAGTSTGNTVTVAVAANFARTHEELARRFELATGNRVVQSAGATGQLYAQIRNGAPFDIYLAADDLRPRLLEEEGLGVPGTRFTYATGRLVLYGPELDSVRSDGEDLRAGSFTNLAIANPRIAPYGRAAEEALSRVGIERSARTRIVQGENVGQALQFVRSGAAELGFVALSQVFNGPAHMFWLVPASYHAPLVQDALLLRPGEASPIARAYLDFLRGDEAAGVIESFGYGRGPTPDP